MATKEESRIQEIIRTLEGDLLGLETYKKANSARLRLLIERYTREIDGYFELGEKRNSILAPHFIGMYNRHRVAALCVLRSRGWIPAWGNTNMREADGSIAWRRKAA